MSKLKVIDCWAPWCGPCYALDASLKEIREKYQQVDFVKINVDKNRKFAKEHNIMALPTLLFMKDGKEVNRIIGAVSKFIIEVEIQTYLGG